MLIRLFQQTTRCKSGGASPDVSENLARISVAVLQRRGLSKIPGLLPVADGFVGASVPSRIGHLNSAEYRVNWGAAGVLDRVPPAAVWTSTSLLQLFARLLGDYKILHACQQRFALVPRLSALDTSESRAGNVKATGPSTGP
jgi:hypothetical protein